MSLLCSDARDLFGLLLDGGIEVLWHPALSEQTGVSIHTYVWLKDLDYLIVMKKYPNGQRRLITAYYVDYENTRRKLRKKYEGRV